VDAERIELERENECFGRYERYLRRNGVLNDELVEAARAGALEVMRAGIVAAEALPEPDPELVTRNAYAE
jgi:TPP-dependent pyruvate/acetoin dehydrogenase alpha subunit